VFCGISDADQHFMLLSRHPAQQACAMHLDSQVVVALQVGGPFLHKAASCGWEGGESGDSKRQAAGGESGGLGSTSGGVRAREGRATKVVHAAHVVHARGFGWG
jgi:hypothetical protein